MGLTIRRWPRAHEPSRAADVRALFPMLSVDLQRLVEGVAGCSPYLTSLMQKEAGWLPQALQDPERALTEEYDRLRDLPSEGVMQGLRQGKRRVALIIALADLCGAWELERVTGALTDFADLAVGLALRAAVGAELRRGKLPGMSGADLETGTGLVVLAMGKMGARELNYSSDIDLIVYYNEERFDEAELLEARPALIRATRKMAAILSEITAEGYVFRTDLRLRPDPSVTPVCMGLEAAERYYESLGRTWERAAYIKARPVAGDIAAGERFLEDLSPFVWRRHLDFAAIEDAHSTRLAIRDSKGFHGALDLMGHDMKLGRGGIREIEFFAQFHQLIAGGRDPSLRLQQTVPALAQLARKGWIKPEVAEALTRHYRAFREVEHRLQMINDAQTHSMPKTAEGLNRLAAFMACDVAELRQDLEARLREVHAVTEAFFAPDVQEGAVAETELERDYVGRWYGYPALGSERARHIFDRLRPQLMESLQRAARPDEAVAAFDGFLKGLPAGVQLFSLFEANPQLIDLIGDICGTVPELALYLSHNSGVLDAVIAGRFFEEWPGVEALCKELNAVLQREEDYETRLDAARRWQKEWHFRIGVHHLRGLIAPDVAGREYAELAEAVLRGIWPVVQAEITRRYGPPPGRGAVIMGMGSLGAGRLNARSDLDLIVIYDPAGETMSQGRRPLAVQTYYARMTQALVTALSAQMSQGRLYEVDMRLRPSGNQGPVATSWQAFQDYQSNHAWIWEHLALTRARVIAGPGALAEDVMAFRRDLIAPGREVKPVLSAVAEMRERIAAARGRPRLWDVKTGPGRNQEIELMAQAGGLIAGDPDGWIADGLRLAVGKGWMREHEATVIGSTYRLMWAIGQVGKLLSGKTLDPAGIGEGGRALLLRDTCADSVEALETRILQETEAAAQAITDVLDRET